MWRGHKCVTRLSLHPYSLANCFHPSSSVSVIVAARRSFARPQSSSATAPAATQVATPPQPRVTIARMSFSPESQEVMSYVYTKRPVVDSTSAVDAAASSSSSSSSPTAVVTAARLPAKLKKLEARRIRAYLAITNAEKKPVGQLFSKEPTRQLYIANAGASCGVTYSDLHGLLSTYGSISQLILIGVSPFALVEFESVESAVAAQRALDAFEWDVASTGNRRFVFVEFAQENASVFLGQQQHPLQLPNATSLAKLSPASVWPLEKLPELINDKDQLLKGIVSGLLLIPDFVSEQEEKDLIEYIASQPWQNVKLRNVQHYGYEFNYKVNNVNRSEPLEIQGKGIPPAFHPLMERLKILGHFDQQVLNRVQASKDAATSSTASNPLASSTSSSSSSSSSSDEIAYIPNQLTVNKYECGNGIPPHVDTHSAFTDIIISISLLSPIVMEFLPTASAKFLLNLPPEPVNIVVPPRSLLCLSGVSRYAYTHAIIPRRTDRIDNVLTPRTTRVSLTFRQLRGIHTRATRPVCNCQFDECDTKLDSKQQSEEKEEKQASSSAIDRNKNTNSPIADDAASSSKPTVEIPSPPPGSNFTPEIEALHRAACEAGESHYIDPATGYLVFTAVGLMKERKGKCCGNACRHCPYKHANVRAKKKQQAKIDW